MCVLGFSECRYREISGKTGWKREREQRLNPWIYGSKEMNFCGEEFQAFQFSAIS